jgi:NADH dehydrogenase
VVIIGGGFAGLRTARDLRNAKVRVTLLDRKNYHLFQPLLYQVATGGLSPANIATPLRHILRKQKNCEVLLAKVQDFDPANKRVLLADGSLTYDTLVLAAGATHSYFGQDRWQGHAPGLKTIAEAADMRSRIFRAFETAEREPDRGRWPSLLTFVIVGGGATGVELAGALAEISNHTLSKDFRRIDPKHARILLIEAGDRILANYPADLCQKAEASIRSLGIEVHTSTKVIDITAEHVRVSHADGEEVIPTRTVLWAAGVQANPLGRILAEKCQVPCDRSGRLPIGDDLSIPGYPEIFVLGDIAACKDTTGKSLPGIAPVAIQQGAYAAALIRKRADGQTASAAFLYKDRGSMATIGRAAAVAQIGKQSFSGFLAWLMWLFVHLMLIVQFQNRVLIFIQWGWYYLTFNRSARLITTEEVIPDPPKPSSESKD